MELEGLLYLTGLRQHVELEDQHGWYTLKLIPDIMIHIDT